MALVPKPLGFVRTVTGEEYSQERWSSMRNGQYNLSLTEVARCLPRGSIREKGLALPQNSVTERSWRQKPEAAGPAAHAVRQ